jgi:hypothetical protein
MHSEEGEAVALKHIYAVNGANPRAFSAQRVREKGAKWRERAPNPSSFPPQWRWCGCGRGEWRERGSGNPRSGAKHRACTCPATHASSRCTARARPRGNASRAPRGPGPSAGAIYQTTKNCIRQVWPALVQATNHILSSHRFCLGGKTVFSSGEKCYD